MIATARRLATTNRILSRVWAKRTSDSDTITSNSCHRLKIQPSIKFHRDAMRRFGPIPAAQVVASQTPLVAGDRYSALPTYDHALFATDAAPREPSSVSSLNYRDDKSCLNVVPIPSSAQSTWSLVITSGGAMRIVCPWVSLARMPLRCSASQ